MGMHNVDSTASGRKTNQAAKCYRHWESEPRASDSTALHAAF